MHNDIDLDNVMSDLKKSSLFNLSLGSKELFHSNFLVYLAESDDTFNKILLSFLGYKPNEKLLSVHREKYNFDILMNTDKRHIVIENKFKSVPIESQLCEYEGKAIKTLKDKEIDFILLSFHKPNFFDNANRFNRWKFVSYSELTDLLADYAKTITLAYRKEMILDYVNFVKNILTLYESFHISDDESIFLSKKRLNGLRDLRIHDLFYKYRYSDILHSITNTIKNDLDNTDIKITDGKDISKLNSARMILAYSTIMRSTGLCEIKFPLLINDGNNIVAGIQLHDHSFRLFIETNDTNLSPKVAAKLLEKRLWFVFDKMYGVLSKNKGQRDTFCNYSSKVYYCYKDIDAISKQELSRLFAHYYMHLQIHRNEIQQALNEVL